MLKPHWREITGDEAVALVQGGKYRDEKPTWVRRTDSIWVRVDEAFRKWRADRTGNKREA